MRRFLFLFILLILSCEKKTKKDESFEVYGVKIDRNTEPMEIAKILIKALDEDDYNVLKKLVAVKTEKKAIIDIFKKYSQKPRITEDEKIINLVVSGWILTYSFFKKGNTIITGDKVGGDSAFVYATGIKLNGSISSFEIKFIREDGYWKVLAGLREL